jgi:PDZ domain/Aspartyl protease
MRIVRLVAAVALAGLLTAGLAGAAEGQAAKKDTAKSYRVPYKLTVPRHIVVRVKLNGKGPFNFILDTGAPALIVSTKAAKKAGIKTDKSWETFDKVAIEGGIRLTKVKARVETPFQLEGMNGMGLAGMEVHGLMGYTLLAKYRMEIDFTSDKMTWTELDFEPKLKGIDRKGKGGGQGGLEVFGAIMKGLGGMLGRQPAPPVTLRGFFGMTLEEGDESPVVKGVLDKGPAGAGGLKVNDVLTKVEGRTVTNVADVLTVLRNADKLKAGSSIKLTVQRGQDTKDVTFKIGEGL